MFAACTCKRKQPTESATPVQPGLRRGSTNVEQAADLTWCRRPHSNRHNGALADLESPASGILGSRATVTPGCGPPDAQTKTAPHLADAAPSIRHCESGVDQALSQASGVHLLPSGSFLKLELVIRSWRRYLGSRTTVVMVSHVSPKSVCCVQYSSTTAFSL